MENRFQRIFLTPFISASTLLLAALSFSSLTNAAEQDNNAQIQVKADVERRQIFDDLLDSENFEVGIQGGIISIEDFESSGWLAAHIGYHITENFYLKARYGQAKGGETSFEKLVNSAPLLTDEQRELTYYGLNIGYNLLPGEIFFSKDLVFNSIFSIELGAGSTEFAGDEQFTVNVTANYRVFINDWVAWDIGMSDYIFDTQVTGESKTTHNLNFVTGVSIYF
ncbi:MAG: outer membrane beta-barrel domain-containing protein [Colwellia sp.]|nr:outer membrane beta-barrel domain-containing protein [Colwellia sp.]